MIIINLSFIQALIDTFIIIQIFIHNSFINYQFYFNYPITNFINSILLNYFVIKVKHFSIQFLKFSMIIINRFKNEIKLFNVLQKVFILNHF